MINYVGLHCVKESVAYRFSYQTMEHEIQVFWTRLFVSLSCYIISDVLDKRASHKNHEYSNFDKYFSSSNPI